MNILVGLEAIKFGLGWSDEQLYDSFIFDMKVRYALCLYDLDEGHFELHTLYNFRKALVEHEKKSGENLIAMCFEKITDTQLEKLQIKTGLQRTDST